MPVYVVPGPTAALSALAISGLPTGRFTFEGFLSVNKRSRKEHLEAVAQEQRTMIFYEAPHKLRKTLSDFAKLFGPDRRIALCRELTKVHEEVWRTTLGEAAAHYRETEPRGEFVLVVAGAEDAPAPEQPTPWRRPPSWPRAWPREGSPPARPPGRPAKGTGFEKGRGVPPAGPGREPGVRRLREGRLSGGADKSFSSSLNFGQTWRKTPWTARDDLCYNKTEAMSF